MPVPGLTSRRGRVWAAGGLVLTLGLVAALLITTLGGARHARAAGDGLTHTTVEVSPSGCGRGWQSPVPGLQVFDLHNTSSGPAEVYLEDPRSRAVYGELEGLAPGTTRPLTVRLGRGSFAFTCLPDDADAVTGPTVRITSGGRSGPAAAPVSEHDLIPLAIDYQKWVGTGLDHVVRLTGRLKDAIGRGDLDAARDAWLPAHLEYERLGAAYDAFGDADAQINGTDAGLAGGVHDPSFAGFHRIEYGLWHDESAQALRAPAAALAKAVRELRDDWAQARMDPAQLGLRAHEILENTVQFELPGRTDYGSGTNLATARANLDGTRAVLSRLHPLLVSRYADLPALEREMNRAQRTLDGFHHGERWTALDRLDRTQREQLDAVLDDLVERLASVATLCDPRRTV
ncbi:EfeM/EfeO family lipoprotein [Streptomyces chiangmaiensis]|uniref:EfeM/EfeO family lipoprotein n=1 Tax=Streptomyces chiangmaiensis TaxID=766497 RepID=A0ABU7FIG3_9ACTN|nr:EfeM/EfeO family lipoprotein [Streptomyces chiangmaiensis]MED7823920.1 EfeM/EfeO family lipoprotein [Streptomyces chiangmaiensis]